LTRPTLIALLLAALLLAARPLNAFADPTTAFMAVRHRGCADKPGTAASLHRNAKLDKVSRLLADGKALREAGLKVGYREKAAATFRIPGVPRDANVEPTLARQFCAQVTDPEYTEIGAYRRGDTVWAVMSRPMVPPASRDTDMIARRILELTNAARASARQCGREPFGAAPPLTLSPLLSRAALEHSKDMATHNLFDHRGSDGLSPGERVTRAGYKWRMAGENIASGMTSAEAVVSGWLASPHHCENIMGPRFTQMGVAWYYEVGSADGIYWTQVFGTPAK
jgi:uncharacterized protein YkwD